LGLDYCSGVQRGNITAFQFHPEKSGPEGVKVYGNWASMNGLL
jgi:imidazoleglycerol phosphate synthase glutamine amidotransferase subunit HisH